jgi:hypothetical protein
MSLFVGQVRGVAHRVPVVYGRCMNVSTSRKHHAHRRLTVGVVRVRSQRLARLSVRDAVILADLF